VVEASIESIANQIGVMVVSSGERLRETPDREIAALQQHMKALCKGGGR
jgi:hypothetical protein